MRKAGVLLPLYSLPSKYGIGCMSKEAYHFIDLLSECGQKLWQILPVGPISYGDSPYQSTSTFAGNYMYIDLEKLVEEGLVSLEDCEICIDKDDPSKVNYERIRVTKQLVLRKAYAAADLSNNMEYQSFKEQNGWVIAYGEYCAFKDYYNGAHWKDWNQDELSDLRIKLKYDIEYYRYIQYLFMKQWMDLKAYANSKGVGIVGDLPIYIAYDSVDCWEDKRLFQLNEDNTPKAVAGCPPDAFSDEGQMWGNPLYNWDYHRETGYGWWIRRIDYCMKMFDLVRIDHFRGFDEYYSIPYGDANAKNGHWEKGPGLPFFNMLKGWFGQLNIIAEDLGILTDSVRELVKDTGFPGMKILHFAFDESRSSVYLPHMCEKNCVIYTGTHDNNTSVGWYKNLSPEVQKYVRDYLDIANDDALVVARALVRQALASTADTAIIPLQDYLLLDEDCRTNIPGTVGNNWCWRVTEEQLKTIKSSEIKKLVELYGR